MVPQVDKPDTHKLLTGLRAVAEATRQEVLGWSFMTPMAERQDEAEALRKLAARSATQTRQWIGRMLHELGSDYPYPNSQDSSTQIIDKTAVPVSTGLDVPAEWSTVQKIKHTRSVLGTIKGELEDLLTGCVPGSFFNQCLFRVQEHAIQSSMWLGELLHEFYEAGITVKDGKVYITPELAQVLADNYPFVDAVVSGESQPLPDISPTSIPTETSFTGKSGQSPSENSGKAEAEAPKNEVPSTATSFSTASTPELDSTADEPSTPTQEAVNSSATEFPAGEAGVPDLTTDTPEA